MKAGTGVSAHKKEQENKMRRISWTVAIAGLALSLAACSDYRSTSQAGQGPPQPFGGGPKYTGDPSAGRGTDFRRTSQYGDVIREEMIIRGRQGGR